MRGALRRAISIVAVFMAVFLLGRIMLLALYPDDFRALAGAGIAWAFLRGAFYDLSVLSSSIGIPLLLMLLPFGWAGRRWWQSLWGWWCFAVLAVLLFIIAGDLVYFGFMHRHASAEVAALGSDLDLLVAMSLGVYGRALLFCVLLLPPLFLLWRYLLSGPRVPSAHPAAVAAALVLLAVTAATGPKGDVDAFGAGSGAEGYLALNAPFSLLRSVGEGPAAVDYMKWGQALSQARSDLFAPGEVELSSDFPLQRRRSAPAGPRPNVVVLMLESWDSAHLDVLRALAGELPLGLTPNFDALSRRGVLFTNFYASGQRSMEGLAALLAGFPRLPGVPYLGFGMERSAMAYLGNLARDEGYSTTLLQSGKRSSFRVDAVAKEAGFVHYLGAEDIPASGHALKGEGGDAFDHDTLQEAHRRFAGAQEPFLGVVFTSSTHGPYPLPGEEWRVLPGESLEERYLNTLFYADWALGRFFAAAEAADYYQNTIFILTGDHVSGFGTRADDIRTLHRIPCLVIAPGLNPGISDRIAGQLDLLPTIIDLAGWNRSHASLGRSAFDADSRPSRGALLVHGNLVARIEEGGYVVHDLRSRLSGVRLRPGYPLDAVERRLLAQVQVATALRREDRIYRPDRPRLSEEDEGIR